MTTIHQKPWSVNDFELYRPGICQFVNEEIIPRIVFENNNRKCNKIIVKAPVKSGKREIVEYICMKDSAIIRSRVHAFVSAWHRTADDDQRTELQDHELTVFSIIKDSKVNEFKKWLNKELTDRKKIVIHLDELDFGSGDTQKLSKIWTDIRNNKNITVILYSATPEEILKSYEIDPQIQDILNEIGLYSDMVEYTPPSGYCGSLRFVNENLVNIAKPFFRTDQGINPELTAQGREIVNGLLESMKINPDRNMIVLRLSYSEISGDRDSKKENKAFNQFIVNINNIPELKNFMIVLDKDQCERKPKNSNIIVEKIDWSNFTYWDRYTNKYPFLIVIDQTSSRSTEWSCHNRVYATHDFRKDSSYSIMCQAQERTNHYESKYGCFQPIKIYGHKPTFLLSAGLIDYTDYLKKQWIAKKIKKPFNAYAIVDPISEIRHPIYHFDYEREEEVNNILIELGCFTNANLSHRIKGDNKEVPEIICFFHKCNEELFDSFVLEMKDEFPSHALKGNRFTQSKERGLIGGRYQGYLRCWKIWNYYDIQKAPGWGITFGHPRIVVCYKDNKLGLAICYATGNHKTMDTLSAINSMYGSRNISL